MISELKSDECIFMILQPVTYMCDLLRFAVFIIDLSSSVYHLACSYCRY